MKWSLTKYHSYRDSGVRWLGSVPSHWRQRPLWAVSEVRRERNPGGLPLLSVFLGRGVILYGEGGGQVHAPSLDLSGYQVVHPGDLVLNNQQAWRGSVGVSRHHGIISPAYIVLRLSSELCSTYADYLMRCPRMVDQFVAASKGVGDIQRQVFWPYLRRVQVAFPEAEEQEGVVRFLDHLTAKVWRQMRAKMKLIALLEERKQVLVFNAVTRGLSPDAALKSSGVPWLGDVPRHWDIVPNRAVMTLRKRLVGHAAREFTLLSLTKRGVIPRDLENPEGKFPSSFESYQVVEPGDLIFCLFDMDETPRTVGLARMEGMITGAYSRFACADPVSAEYAYWLYLALDNEKRLKPLYSGLRKVITKSAFLSAKMPLPPFEERVAILRYVKEHTDAHNQLVSRTEREISLLREYHTRVVTDVVTGQVDVSAAAQLMSDVRDGEELEPTAEDMSFDVRDRADADHVDPELQEA